MTFSAIENTAIVARQAGFTGNALVTMVAIAGCESEYNPTALDNNPKTGDYSVGLWQINYYGSLLASRTALYGPPSGLTDPLANAKAAFSVSGGGANFSPWTTYTSGCYLKNMPAAAAAVAATASFSGSIPGWTTGVSAGSSGSINGSTVGSNGSATLTSSSSDCLISLPGVDLGVGTLGGNCIFSVSQARAVGGALLVVGGGLVALAGVVLLVAHTGVGKSAMQFAGPVGSAASTIASRVPNSAPRPDRDDKRAIAAPPSPKRMPKGDVYNKYGERVDSRGNLLDAPEPF